MREKTRALRTFVYAVAVTAMLSMGTIYGSVALADGPSVPISCAGNG